MNKIIKIKAWNNKIALIADIDNKLTMELIDDKYSCFSPIRFNNDRFAEITLKNNSKDIDDIGIIADCISGSYGSDYFNKYFLNEKGQFPTILDRLSFIGANGLGALEFEPSDTLSELQSNELIFSLSDFKNESINIYKNESKNSELSKLVAKSNSGAGGAKAKAVVNYNPKNKKIHLSQSVDEVLDGYEKFIIKFNTKSDEEVKIYNEELKIEYIYYLLSIECDLQMSDCYLECDSEDNCYFITKRFDVDDNGNRLHLHSLAGIFSHNAEPFSMGYEMLFRAGNMLSVSKKDKEQMFKNMIFNIVFANRDDHSRNFSFLMDSSGEWRFAPAYDLTYCASNHHILWHQLTIDSKPTSKVRSLGIVKIAKLCEVVNPLEIISNFIEIKNTKLRELADKYHISNSAIDSIFEDTKEIDKTFYKGDN